MKNESIHSGAVSTASQPRRSILRSNDVASTTLPKQRVGPSNPNQAGLNGATQASVKLNKVDGQVVSIVVTCACGEEVFLRCDYE